MPVIYLIRHGQASFGAENYDALSDAGWEQSRILGRHLLGRRGRCRLAVNIAGQVLQTGLARKLPRKDLDLVTEPDRARPGHPSSQDGQLGKRPASQRRIPFERVHLEKAHRVMQLNRWRPVTSSEDVRSSRTPTAVAAEVDDGRGPLPAVVSLAAAACCLGVSSSASEAASSHWPSSFSHSSRCPSSHFCPRG